MFSKTLLFLTAILTNNFLSMFISFLYMFGATISGKQGAPCIPDSHPHRVTNTKCRIDTVISPDDGHIVSRNM